MLCRFVSPCGGSVVVLEDMVHDTASDESEDDFHHRVEHPFDSDRSVAQHIGAR